MAKAYETSKKKKGNPYVATGLRSMQRQIKESLKNPETKAYYNDVKKRFKVGTTTEKRLRDRGIEGEELLEYFKREIDIISGSYEKSRNQQFIDNYIKAAQKMGVSEVTLKHFIELVTSENLNDVVRDLKGDIELYDEKKSDLIITSTNSVDLKTAQNTQNVQNIPAVSNNSDDVDGFNFDF